MMTSREERIANLASTLKSSGLAKSEVQAKMMAEEMIGVEENVQKKYDVEHDRAQEFLRTTKNLGDPRISNSNTAQKVSSNNLSSNNLSPNNISSSQTSGRRIEPLKMNSDVHDEPIIKPIIRSVEPIISDVKSASESSSTNLKDLMLGQIRDDNHVVKNIEELPPTVPVGDSVHEIPKVSDVAVESSVPSVGLDGAKLAQMMEEDGPLEEHTREIKEKPKNVKPKEEYAENNIDLSNMFNVNKR